MKQIYKLVLPVIMAICVNACSEKETGNEEELRLEGVIAELAGRDTEENKQTRAAFRDFAVNGSNDPTLDNTRLNGAMGWKLDIRLYDKNGAVYGDANGIWNYDATTSPGYWRPNTVLYYPSYVTPGWMPFYILIHRQRK